jgi:aspartate carbamoyltransferase catalytic subunit
MQLSVKHLLGIKDLTPEDIRLILDTATQFKEVLQRPIKKVPSLRDVTVVNLFFENSTRTRISFELAEKRLSADTINFTASASSVAKGETLLAQQVLLIFLPNIFLQQLLMQVTASTNILPRHYSML